MINVGQQTDIQRKLESEFKRLEGEREREREREREVISDCHLPDAEVNVLR